MDRPIRYHPLFESDVREAVAWYDQRCAGLGNAFVEAVRQSVNNIISDPTRFSETSVGCRYVRTRRFPYVVLFDVDDDELLILGVLHTARSMQRWNERQDDG